MDDQVQDWINGLAGHAGIVDSVMKASAHELVFLAVPFVVLLWFWPAASTDRALNQRLAVAIALGVIGAIAGAKILGQLHYEARPFASDASTRQLIAHVADNSFPSDHASLAFAVGGAAVWWRRLLGAGALLVAGFIGLARVFVGVHWPSDVIAGALVGLSAGALAALTVPIWREPQRWASRLLPRALLTRP